MSNTPIKTAEEILDSIPDDPNQDGVCYTLNETLAAVYAYHAQFEGRGEGVRELVDNIHDDLENALTADPGNFALLDSVNKVLDLKRKIGTWPLPSTKGEDENNNSLK